MNQLSITIVTPCYNESVFALRFLESLEQSLGALPYRFHVVIVNDCSTDDTLAQLKQFRFAAANMRLHIVNLRFNVGHQAAIFQGFLFARTLGSSHFVVMDSDGEDSPAAIPELLHHLDADIVNVVRNKRKESLLFRMFYRIYKLIFKMVTGKQMNFGNFCLISRKVLDNAIFTSFSHFAAFLSKQKGNIKYIVADREERIGGQSKMGFKKLFYHAFKSFVEYGEDLLMLFFKGFIIIMGVLALVIGNVLYQKFIAHTAITGWTSTMLIGLINLAIMCIGFFVTGLLLLNLNNQNPNSKTAIYEISNEDTTGESV
jgi:glycosyltransferase involved in cell wall biosynthesis